MPSLQVREVPEAVYGALSEASRREHRSLSQQALVTLERGLGLREESPLRRKRLLEAIADTPISAAEALPDPVDMIREDRNR